MDERIAVSFIEEPDHEETENIISLYRSVGWWDEDDSPELVEKIVRGSYLFALARIENTVAGMGRVISDGVSDAYIQDIIVDESYRRRGVASAIIKTFIEKLRAGNMSWTGLIAEPGSAELYKKCGFKEMSAYTPMIMEYD
jgi:spermidine synthase